MRSRTQIDLGSAHAKPHLTSVFDLGKSGGSDIARHKDAMIADAFTAAPKPKKPQSP